MKSLKELQRDICAGGDRLKRQAFLVLQNGATENSSEQ